MSVVYVEMENVLKINAGTACLDRSNEVEPRPNEGNHQCHPNNAVIAKEARLKHP
ncbi:MAG: hypothetical protein LBG80_10210 [Bacteroidales bacterium]|nr:hypothetical protein [Bacteroidales bacterium]